MDYKNRPRSKNIEDRRSAGFAAPFHQNYMDNTFKPNPDMKKMKYRNPIEDYWKEIERRKNEGTR